MLKKQLFYLGLQENQSHVAPFLTMSHAALNKNVRKHKIKTLCILRPPRGFLCSALGMLEDLLCRGLCAEYFEADFLEIGIFSILFPCFPPSFPPSAGGGIQRTIHCFELLCWLETSYQHGLGDDVGMVSYWERVKVVKQEFSWRITEGNQIRC